MKSFFMEQNAEFSPDRIYRYTLSRIWDDTKGYAAFVGLNPSTADETKDDPTIRRCIGYAHDWGYGGLYMLNLFALRSTDPSRLYESALPIGTDNNFYLQKISAEAGITIAAWGNYGRLMNRDIEVLKLLTIPHCLGITKAGYPRHPLYLKKSLRPIKYNYRKIRR